MNGARLKEDIMDALWRVVDRHDSIVSATLTGSFVNSPTLDGLSDIDFVVIADHLNQTRFMQYQRDFAAELQPVLEKSGYRLQINPTLGPLKFNEPDLAVLHLMLYSEQSHSEHVINSPFTCLDWQSSTVFRKRSMAEVYPAFGLQPRHFVSARRSISDYLRDFRNSVVSYRELVCDRDGYREKLCSKSMDSRDRHEFAYHVMRFLMLNLVKLVSRTNENSWRLDELMDRYFEIFPFGQEDARTLLVQLAAKKRHIDYAVSIDQLDRRLERFIADFEQQFRSAFIDEATRHVVFRHAPTHANLGPTRFLGRSDLSIVPDGDDSVSDWRAIGDMLQDWRPERVYASPLLRCRETFSRLGIDQEQIVTDNRLIEMNYGLCELLTTGEVRARYPQLFEDWHRAIDSRFPGGENSSDVMKRTSAFAQERWTHGSASSLTCTHNVVLRNLVGDLLNVPLHQRYRIQIPHLAPIELVSTQRFGLFVNLTESAERELFRNFSTTPTSVRVAS